MKKIQFCATYKLSYPCGKLLLAMFLTQIKSWPSFSDPGQKKVPSLTTFLLEAARRPQPTLAWPPKRSQFLRLAKAQGTNTLFPFTHRY